MVHSKWLFNIAREQYKKAFWSSVKGDHDCLIEVKIKEKWGNIWDFHNQLLENTGSPLNPLTPKISLVILFTICHIILMMLVQRIWYWINYEFPNWYCSLFSLLVCLILYWCNERRNYVYMVTHGSLIINMVQLSTGLTVYLN